MAKLEPPKKDDNVQPISKKVEKAKPTKPTEQAAPDAIKPLQLKIPESKKNDFKAYAALRGKSMNTLFLEMFEEYKEKHA